MNSIKGSQLRKVVLVSKRNVNDTMMRERGHGSDSCRLLSTSLSGSRHKQTTVLAPKTTTGPETTSLVPERLNSIAYNQPNSSYRGKTRRETHLPLSREVTVTSGNANQEGIVGLEDVRSNGGDLSRRAWRMHFGQNFLRQGLSDSAIFVNVCIS